MTPRWKTLSSSVGHVVVREFVPYARALKPTQRREGEAVCGKVGILDGGVPAKACGRCLYRLRALAEAGENIGSGSRAEPVFDGKMTAGPATAGDGDRAPSTQTARGGPNA